MSVAEIQERLAETLNELAERGEPVVVERYGEPVAVLVSVEDYARLEALGPALREPGHEARVRAAWARVKARHEASFRALAEHDRRRP
jgi:prevent-host-death family protein